MSDIIFKLVLDHTGKEFLKKPFGRVEQDDCQYAREKARGLSYVRYGPEVRPTQDAIAFHSILCGNGEKIRNAAKAPDKSGLVAFMRAEMEGGSDSILGMVTAKQHVTVDIDENKHVMIRQPGVNVNRWIFWLHGGGFVAGDPALSSLGLQVLCKSAGTMGVAMKYPLAPESSIEEMSAFIRSEIDRILEENTATENDRENIRVIVGGDSSGGGLALKVAFDSIRDGTRRFDALCLASPYENLKANTPSYETNDAFDYDPVELCYALGPFAAGNLDVKAQPTGANNVLQEGFDGDWKELPPTYILSAGLELELDDAFRIAANIDAAGGKVVLDLEPFMFHCYTLIPVYDEAVSGIARAAQFLRDVM